MAITLNNEITVSGKLSKINNDAPTGKNVFENEHLTDGNGIRNRTTSYTANLDNEMPNRLLISKMSTPGPECQVNYIDLAIECEFQEGSRCLASDDLPESALNFRRISQYEVSHLLYRRQFYTIIRKNLLR